MPSIQTQFKLADLLKTIADGEKQIEIVRQILAEKTAFEPYTAFKRIDRDSLGYVATIDLVDFLRDNQVAVTEKELRLVLQEQNAVRDDRLSYTEFLNVLLPKTDSVLRQIVTQRESYFVARNEVLCYEVEHALARVFEKEVDLAIRVETLRKDLADRYDFDALNLFKVADIDRLGALDIDTIYTFLKENGVSATENEILALLRRTDRDHDGKLSFSEFYNAITTKDPFHKSTLSTSTARLASPSRLASPTRRVASPVRTVASPLRNRSSPKLRTSTYASKTAEKLSNYDYIDYVHTSARKSARSRSPGLTRSNNFARSIANVETPKKVASPYRQSITRRNLEAELSASTLSASRLRTPTRRVASPVRTTTTSFIREAVSPMKGNEEEHLATALNEQINIDKDLENVKIDLAIRRDFNLLDAFKFFDVEGKAFIGRTEIKETLNEFGIFPTYDEISLLLKKYDRNNEGILRFINFSEILAPKDSSYAEILSNRVPSYTENVPLDQIFSDETIFQLKKALKAVISNLTYSETIRQKLNRRPLFDQYEGFKALDKDQNGYVRGYQVKELLNDHGYFASQKEVNTLIERYDKNQDGKISYSEFTSEITPKSPIRY